MLYCEIVQHLNCSSICDMNRNQILWQSLFRLIHEITIQPHLVVLLFDETQMVCYDWLCFKNFFCCTYKHTIYICNLVYRVQNKYLAISSSLSLS